jgi:hypothetical protein
MEEKCQKHKDTVLRWRKDKKGKYCPVCMDVKQEKSKKR